MGDRLSQIMLGLDVGKLARINDLVLWMTTIVSILSLVAAAPRTASEDGKHQASDPVHRKSGRTSGAMKSRLQPRKLSRFTRRP